jgi:hypothetical protein
MLNRFFRVNLSLPIVFSMQLNVLFFLQEAANGIGVCAEFAQSKFKTIAGAAVVSLNSVIRHPDSSSSENRKAYDIAVSALGKICKFHRESINAPQVVPTWLSYLPIKDDSAEAKVVHEQLCSMVER